MIGPVSGVIYKIIGRRVAGIGKVLLLVRPVQKFEFYLSKWSWISQ
jgi:hypothetical protein